MLPGIITRALCREEAGGLAQTRHRETQEYKDLGKLAAEYLRENFGEA
jgi:hypothetical protein